MKPITNKWHIDNRNGDLNYLIPSGDDYKIVRMSTRRGVIEKGSISRKEMNLFFTDINQKNPGRIVLLKKSKLSRAVQKKFLKLIFEKW